MHGFSLPGPVIWTVILAIAVLGLYFAGGLVSKNSIEVAGCRAEWDTIARTVQSSELCPTANGTCLAEPYIMQHNAVVDALLCACGRAGSDYSNADVTRALVEAYQESTDLTLSAREICEGGQLTKWAYRG